MRETSQKSNLNLLQHKFLSSSSVGAKTITGGRRSWQDSVEMITVKETAVDSRWTSKGANAGNNSLVVTTLKIKGVRFHRNCSKIKRLQYKIMWRWGRLSWNQLLSCQNAILAIYAEAIDFVLPWLRFILLPIPFFLCIFPSEPT